MTVTLPEPPSVERYLSLRDRMATVLPERYNIAAATCDRWARGDGRTAMIVPTGATVRRLSFDHFAEESSRLANGLEAIGVGRGDRVAVCLPQTPECASVHLAIQRLGAIVVPISTISGSGGIRHRLADSGASVLVAGWESHAWLADDELAGALTLVMIGDELPAGITGYTDLIASSAPDREPVDSLITDPAILIYTSGTTGAAKGALHAQRVVPAHAEPMAFAHNLFGRRSDDTLWSPADWAWAGGLIDCLFSTWTFGRPIVAWRPPGFDPHGVLDLIDRCGITHTFLPPTALKRMRDTPGIADRARNAGLRSIMTGGERAGADLVDWCTETFGVTPNEVFGQTECSMVLGNIAPVLPVRPGAVGMEYPRVTAAVLDDADEPLSDGKVGEIALHRSTPAMFLGYWNQAAGRAQFRGQEPGAPAPEWHRTGDLGRRDSDGYYWHEGRADDVILSSGYRIGPAEVEDVLGSHPAVAAAVVIGEPDEMRGELVSAVIELQPGHDGDDPLRDVLKAMVREQLAAYEVPRRIRFVDTLPRTESGKVRRSALRQSLREAGA